MHERLAHPGREEQLVVHREPEQDTHEDHGQEAQDRARVVHAEQLTEPAPLEHGRDRAVGCEQREHEAAGRDERDE